jgi:hypothetical protein
VALQVAQKSLETPGSWSLERPSQKTEKPRFVRGFQLLSALFRPAALKTRLKKNGRYRTRNEQVSPMETDILDSGGAKSGALSGDGGLPATFADPLRRWLGL